MFSYYGFNNFILKLLAHASSRIYFQFARAYAVSCLHFFGCGSMLFREWCLITDFSVQCSHVDFFFPYYCSFLIGCRKDASYVILASYFNYFFLILHFLVPFLSENVTVIDFEKDIIFTQRNTDFEYVHYYKAALHLVVLAACHGIFLRSDQDHLLSFSATIHVQKFIYEFQKLLV